MQSSRRRTFARVAPLAVALGIVAAAPRAAIAQANPNTDAGRLAAAFLGDTPLLRDLESLADEVGGRATGSPANLRAVEWALARFRDAAVAAKREPFTMPSLWLERSASATVSGDGISFSPRVAAMPFSAPTPGDGVRAPLVDGGFGAAEDFTRLGAKAKGAFVLVEQPELRDIDGLFREYDEAASIEERARAAGAAGVVYMGSRPNDLLYRHNVAIGSANTQPMLVMETDGARRALRLIRAGKPLAITERVAVQTGGPYASYNVIGEIRGAVHPDEIVLLGAHLDSWDLGDGALDDGANVAMLIDIARQMHRLGLTPARTIRFALWNGEEEGMEGSFGYVRAHAAELDQHVVAMAFDIGCGRITGFFTNGRADLLAPVERALDPVRGLGPFEQVNVPIVGTDNFDFMLQGIPNLVANQEPASYGPNYHARSDTFDKCDGRQLRLNAATVAVLAWELARDLPALPRQTRAQVEQLVTTTSLGKDMKTFNLWTAWEKGMRGRSREHSARAQ